MKISNRLFVLVMALCSVGGLADQLPGIAEFTDGEPALAEEVNGNNLVISDKAQELEARILQLENVSDRLVRDEDTARYGGARSAEPSAAATNVGGLTELLGGKLYLDNIDCNADPHALNKAYIDNSQYSYIQFTYWRLLWSFHLDRRNGPYRGRIAGVRCDLDSGKRWDRG